MRAEVPALAYLNLRIEARRIRIIAQPKDPAHVKSLMDAVDRKYREYPGMRAFVSRGSIITSNDGGSRSVNLDISGPSLDSIYEVALKAYRRAREVFDRPRIRANPSTLSLSQPAGGSASRLGPDRGNRHDQCGCRFHRRRADRRRLRR